MVAYRLRFGYFPIYFELFHHGRLNHFHRALVRLVNENMVDGFGGLVDRSSRLWGDYIESLVYDGKGRLLGFPRRRVVKVASEEHGLCGECG